MMARHYCVRCGEECNTLNDPRHLCKDIKARYARQERQIEAVVAIIIGFGAHDTNEDRRDLAAGIVQCLNRLGIGKD